MNHIFRLTFTSLLACSLLWGCRTSHDDPPFRDFANRNCWDPAKQQRWDTFRETFEFHYARVPDPAAGSSSRDDESDDGVNAAQSDLDHLEQRRTGDPHAKSCRRAVIPGRFYDSSNCSPWQLAAELFEEDEENHNSK